MGKESSPSINVPNPPSIKSSYKQGVNLELDFLDRFLKSEMQARNTYDPQRIAEQQSLQARFGPTQYRQMLEALKMIDPTGYNLRESTGKAIQANMNGQFSPGQVQTVRRAEASRGNTYGQAAVTGEASKLSQDAIQNSLNFQNSATPESWLQMIPPVQADRSMAYVNPNAGWMGVNAANQQYQNQLGAAAAQMQGGGGGSWMSAIGSIASTIGPIIGAAFSDRRLKNKVKPVGKLNGHKMYEFEYKGEPGVKRVGPMAQEVEKKNPDAVMRDPRSGYKKVDYRKLGLPLPMPV